MNPGEDNEFSQTENSRMALVPKRQKPCIPPSETNADEDAHTYLRPDASLCEKCQNLFDEWKLDNAYSEFSDLPEHHESIVALEFSSNNGCELCSQFLLGVWDEIEPWFNHPNYVSSDDSSENKLGTNGSHEGGAGNRYLKPHHGTVERVKGYKTKYALNLWTPYTKGASDSSYDDRSDIELLCIRSSVDLYEAREQGICSIRLL